MKLKLTGAGFENYTGQMGVVFFENGLSKYDVMPNDAIRIASTIGAVWENGDPANLGAIHTQNLMTPAPDIRQQSGLELLHSITGHAHLNADQVQQYSDQVASLTTGVEKQESTAKKAEPKYTQEALEKIADESGIAGLREIAAEFDVKGNSIATLIKAIMNAQE